MEGEGEKNGQENEKKGRDRVEEITITLCIRGEINCDIHA